MIDRILTVGGITLLSRVTGFLRDIMLAAVLGAGPVADAFFVALRLPNHFRAIFAEGAFNAAFIPAYARVRVASGSDAVRVFGDRIFTLLLASQIVLLGAALLFTPGVIDLLAPGFSKEPAKFALAIELTRITFPYLLLVSLVTLYGGILNALDRFAAAAAAPILLNLSMMMTLGAGRFFSDRGTRRSLGRAARRVSGIFPGRRRRRAERRAAALRLAADRPGGDVVPQTVLARHHRFGRHPDRAVRRHHHRKLPRHRRAVGAVLCRPAEPASDRRDRNCRRHRAAAGDGAADHRRRRGRRQSFAESRDRVDAAVVGALPGGVPDRAGPDHARAVRPRRLHPSRCSCRRPDA